MNDRQENKFEMFLVVRNVLTGHTTAWQGLPAFVTAEAEFRDLVTQLETYTQQQDEAIAGNVQAKAEARQALADTAFQVAAATRAYGLVNGDPQLAARVDFSRTSFLYGRDSDALLHARTVRDAADENLANLADYGVTAELYGQLEDHIDAYAAVLEAPRGGIVERAVATRQIADTIAAIDAVLKERLDNLVPILAPANPAFAEAYRSARVIIDRSGPSEELEEATDEPAPEEP